MDFGSLTARCETLEYMALSWLVGFAGWLALLVGWLCLFVGFACWVFDRLVGFKQKTNKTQPTKTNKIQPKLTK